MRYLTTMPMIREELASFEVCAGGRAGAVVTFAGLVRADQRDGQIVAALNYEAYPDMAERQIERLEAEAQVRWPLEAMFIRHRVGLVEAGQISVAVMVAAPHRAEAYAASQFLIERIKREVPIWKRERYDESEVMGVLHADV